MTDEARVEHRLEGLEPDNLLAFLALLGLLRALEEVRPSWRPRTRWSLDHPPHRPVLVLRQPEPAAAVAMAAAEGVAKLAAAHEFDRKLLNFSPEEARSKLEQGREDATRANLWSALISDAAFDETKGLVRKTPLNFLDVAQVAFLKTLGAVCSRAETPKRGLVQSIYDACFLSWTRKDDTLSFRWDIAEDSRYAYRANAPTFDKQLVEHGANVLASIGLRTMTIVPIQSSRGVQIATRGVASNDGIVFRWPLWAYAISLSAIESLLNVEQWSEDLRRRMGVATVMSARRINAPGSKYRNVSPSRSEEATDPKAIKSG